MEGLPNFSFNKPVLFFSQEKGKKIRLGTLTFSFNGYFRTVQLVTNISPNINYNILFNAKILKRNYHSILD
jgi:hypothetical protein